MHLHIKPTSLAAALGIVTTLGLAGLVQGQTLNSGHNTAVISLPNNAAYSATDGLNILTRNDPVSPADHIQDVGQNWLFYSTGAGAHQSVGQLFLRFSGTADQNGDGKPDQLTATYANDLTATPSLIITETTNLIGSGSNTNASYQSAVTRNISVRTTFGSPTDVHVFDYTNMTPTMVESPTAAGQYSQDIGPTFAQQVGRSIRVWQNTGGGQLITDSRTDSDPLLLPSHYQIAADPASIAALVANLKGGSGDLASTFSGVNGAVIPGGVGGPTSTASIAYALQYDILGATSGTSFINETLTVTPEPASLALLAIGGTMIMMRRRRAV